MGVVKVDGSKVELTAPVEGGEVEVVEGRALARRRHWKAEEDHRRRRGKERRRIGIEEKEKTTIGEGG